MAQSAPKRKRISFSSSGKKISFLAKVHKARKPAACADTPIGGMITRKSKKGTIKMERVRKFGKKRNLCWKIRSMK